MKSVLVTGSYGQLAACIKDIANQYPKYSFIFTDLPELDITNKEEVLTFFKNNNVSWCINCAAYTNVDKAESEKQISYQVNEIGPNNLAQACNEYKVKLIHISTDFVFDGKIAIPYSENDKTKPISVYGDSKLKGEKAITSILDNYFIIRTSWLYSEHGNNFMKTMLKLSKERDEINIVSNQIGTPTYGGDLAKVILEIVNTKSNQYGIYHYSNEGVASWFDFAKAIFKLSAVEIKVNPIPAKDYPTPAERPQFSVLDKTKIKQILDIKIPHWEESLNRAIINLK